MSKQELLELVAPLSAEERRQLRELCEELDERELQPLSSAEVEDDPMMKLVRDIERLPPMDAPRDFSINHDFYIRGGEKRAA